jgi:hypothetical protein
VESIRHKRKRLAEAEKIATAMVLEGEVRFHSMGLRNLIEAMNE